VPVVLDLDAPAPGVERLLAQADFPVVSRGFAEAAYGGAEPALARLAALGARLPVVTLGADGALARVGERLIASPAIAAPVLDTTGAGDVFHGAFAWGLLQGFGAEELLRVANAAAAFACTGPGAQGAIPAEEDLYALLEPGYSSS
jgi:sugar/nucleoside kinase (ribokinase family)